MTARDEAIELPDTGAVDAEAVLAGLADWWRNPGYTLFDETPDRIAGSEHDQLVPAGTQSPYWEIARQLPLEEDALYGPRPVLSTLVCGRTGPRYTVVTRRLALCRTFAWSVPSPGDITWMRELLAGRGVVEAGAGGGYWAWQMRQAGIDVVAYEPREPAGNHFVHREWAQLARDDHEAAGRHPDRALFLCWPTPEDSWAARALSRYTGDLLIYCGTRWCCADDAFFKLLDDGWDIATASPAHVSFEGIGCVLTAFRRKTPRWKARRPNPKERA